MRVDDAPIPGGWTKHIQTPDVFWNMLFKGCIIKNYDELLASGAPYYTETENIKRTY